MNLTELSQSSTKICIVQYMPGTGFQANIKQDCKEKNIDIIFINAESQNVILDVKTSTLRRVPIIPKITLKTLIIVEEFEHLNSEQQIDVMSKIKDKATSPDVGIIIPVRDLWKISPEVLKESVFAGNTESLPALGPSNILMDLLEDTSNINLTEIRRKYTSGDSNNKNTPK